MNETMVLEFEIEGEKEQMVVANEKMKKIVREALEIKEKNLSVLLTGETGTGKDILAEAIHYTSNRQKRNFVVFTCPAVPETLVESELFGHRKGAYTGASESAEGLIEQAEGGTLYLNEVSEINNSIQVKLLRVVEEKEITRLGENKPRKIDFRIIASTNGNLLKLLEDGKFRKDLYFRLKVAEFHLPPLRERPEDITVLTEYFLKKHGRDERKLTLDPQILNLFLNYNWPGNVRELENVITNLIAFAKDKENISLDFFQQNFEDHPYFSKTEIEKSFNEAVENLEKELILKALVRANWVKKEAAQKLKMPESTLRYKMKYYGITRPL